MQKRRWKTLGLLRRLLTLGISSMVMMALFSVHIHIFPSSEPLLPDAYKLPTQHEIGYHKSSSELHWTQEIAPPHLSKAPLPSRKLDDASGILDSDKLWKPPPNQDYVPCVESSQSYTYPIESRGYLLVHTNGGLNQMRAGICDMVAVARIINATLVIPELDKRSFWQDKSNFSDVFDEDYFINSLANDVKVIRKLPKKLLTATRAVKHFRSWSGIDYYQDEIASMWEDYQVIRAAKSDSRLANNNLPPEIQKLRCRACYEALRFAPRIEAMGKLLVSRMRSYGPYIALHLRYEKDMLAFSGCTHDLSSDEADELRAIRENTAYWKVKDIDSMEQRAKGYCPLTPKEVGVFLSALEFPSNTPIYIAAGDIYGGDSHMADLQSRYPLLMNKWGLFDRQFGRFDTQEPDPEGRVLQWEKASVQEMKDKFSAVGLGPRQLAVMSSFLGPDQIATEALLATDPDVAPWVQKYQRSRETVSETDYQVDLITALTKISSLGQQINYEAYTYPVKKIDFGKLKL